MATFRSLATFPVTLFLATFSLINISFAFFATALLVPVYTLLNRQSSRFGRLLQLVLLLPLNPFVFALLSTSQEAVEVIVLNSFLEISLRPVVLTDLVALYLQFGALHWPLVCFCLFPLNTLAVRACLLSEAPHEEPALTPAPPPSTPAAVAEKVSPSKEQSASPFRPPGIVISADDALAMARTVSTKLRKMVRTG